MSKASGRADARAEPRVERGQPGIAAPASALLHRLFVLIALLSPPITVTTPQGTAAGSPMVVDFVGITPPQPTQAPPATAKPATRPAEKPPAASRVRTTTVARADAPIPPDASTTADNRTTPTPPEVPAAAAPAPAQAATPSAPPMQQRRAHTWGQPPGMLPENHAAENVGLARSASTERGRRNDSASGQPNLEVGGYQVYYDLRSETRLRAWRDRGMTEIFIPLPGTRRLMVCPLEIALRRDSGDCRLLDPDSPELQAIGDAREVINMQQVYRRGELVWRGPGPYR